MDNNGSQAAHSISKALDYAPVEKVSEGVWTVTVGDRTVTAEDHAVAGYWLTTSDDSALDTVGDAVAWLKGAKATVESLAKAMDFDTVIEVREGRVTVRHDIYTPEVYQPSDEEGNHTGEPSAEGWELMSGYTSQYGYNGASMHPSEYIGGRLAEDILENDGLYVCVAVFDDDDDAGTWVVATREG